MSVVRGSFAELLFHRAGINEVKMGQLNGYDALQNAMMGQQQAGNQYQGLLGQAGGSIGNIGGLLNQNITNPFLNTQEPIYPNKLFPNTPLRYNGIREWAEKVANLFGFEWSFDSDSFIHPNGAYVSRRALEDSQGQEETLTQLFRRALTPNMHWLEGRINEIRVKLC